MIFLGTIDNLLTTPANVSRELYVLAAHVGEAPKFMSGDIPS